MECEEIFKVSFGDMKVVSNLRMERWESYKPVMVMLLLQIAFAGMTILSKASFSQGMSPRVFVFYRQAFGTLFTAPLAYFSRSTTERLMGWKSFLLIFITTLIGITGTEMLVYQGVSLASSSAASALLNLIPAVTFVLASVVGFEPINIQSLRTIVKILGTLLSVSGAATMALIKGPKLLNGNLSSSTSLSLNSPGNDNLWLLGCLCVFGGCCCWSSWLVIQVPVTRNYPDHLSLSAWTCFFSMVQSAVITSFTDPYLESWEIKSYLQLGTCLYAGLVGSGLKIFVQSWIIARRGPVFSAMFQPLRAVIVTFLAYMFLQEQIYIGSALGSLGIVSGLYTVLWGKAKDAEILKEEQEKMMMISQYDQTNIVQAMVGGSNLKIPLLTKKSTNFDSSYSNQV